MVHYLEGSIPEEDILGSNPVKSPEILFEPYVVKMVSLIFEQELNLENHSN